MAQKKTSLTTKRLAEIAGIMNEELGLDPAINTKGKKGEIVSDILEAGDEIIPEDKDMLEEVADDLTSLGVKLPWIAPTEEAEEAEPEEADTEEEEEEKAPAGKPAPKKEKGEGKKAPAGKPKKATAGKSKKAPAEKDKTPRLQRPLVVIDSFTDEWQNKDQICEAADAAMDEAGQSNLKQTKHVFNVYLCALIHTGFVKSKKADGETLYTLAN
jgi:outer membrane biosynthesis protein TonB